jgi:deoxyribodipyrimidine photo-lyase
VNPRASGSAPVRSICWFRRDLRLADNPALAAAAASGTVVPCFVVDPKLWDVAGKPRRAFLAATLRRLDEATDEHLEVRVGDPVDEVVRLAEEVGASEVFAAEDFGPYGRRRDEAVAKALGEAGRRLELVGSPYAVAPGEVRKADGEPYAVFTPFARGWNAAGWPAPDPAPKVTWHRRTGRRFPSAQTDVVLPAAGEAAAHTLLRAFLEDGVHEYHAHRDEPGVDGTSRLSPYLRWGTLHPRQILAELGRSKGAQVFRAELAWREFYADVLLHHPTTGWENLQRRMDALPVDADAAARRRFQRWADGQTGYPIVDAGMRQLRATGWMHNRVRMLTASFLVKDLHLPWQWGARHFMAHLVDGDLASNSHGWQWTAGTGTDPAPYFRIFNPVSQGERFDPEGAYVRQWLPELDGVEDRYVQQPWSSATGDAYPPPMVDHAEEREEALRRYAAVTGR